MTTEETDLLVEVAELQLGSLAEELHNLLRALSREQLAEAAPIVVQSTDTQSLVAALKTLMQQCLLSLTLGSSSELRKTLTEASRGACCRRPRKNATIRHHRAATRLPA